MICFNSPCGFAVSHCFFSLSEFSNATLFLFSILFYPFFSHLRTWLLYVRWWLKLIVISSGMEDDSRLLARLP